MNRAQKEELAASLADKFEKAKVTIFADYKGLGASDSDELRKLLRDNSGEVKVVKNNVIRQAVKKMSISDDAQTMIDGLVGPTMLSFAYDDPAAVAKIFHKFSESHEAIEIKDSLLGKDKVTSADVKALADLPPREQLLGMLLSTFNGPARGFVSVLAAVPRDFVGVLAAVQRKKEEASE